MGSDRSAARVYLSSSKSLKIGPQRAPNRELGMRVPAPIPRYSALKKTKGESVLDSTARLRRAARERADDEARRIPWQRLYDVRNQYIDWQAFYLWVRSILEVEDGIPNWLVEILNDRCPGFLETEKALTSKGSQKQPLALRLEDWIDD